MHARYEALMDVVRGRMTNRAFAPAEIPREHVEMILESARHAPSGANAQPWHYVVVTDPAVKRAIGQRFVDEQQRRARLRMGFPTPNYHGVKTAPGLVIVVADFRFVRAFPVLNDGSELDRRYRQNAERILLQSVAASTMTRTSGSVPDARTNTRPSCPRLDSLLATASQTGPAASSASRSTTSTLIMRCGYRCITDASSRIDDPVRAASERNRTAVSKPSPVVERSRKITWPDCSPPRGASIRTMSSRT